MSYSSPSQSTLSSSTKWIIAGGIALGIIGVASYAVINNDNNKKNQTTSKKNLQINPMTLSSIVAQTPDDATICRQNTCVRNTPIDPTNSVSQFTSLKETVPGPSIPSEFCGGTIVDNHVYGTASNNEVYLYQPTGMYTIRADEASDLAHHLGGRLATMEELKEAARHGAQWCVKGWVYDESLLQVVAAWPMQEIVNNGRDPCGRIGVNRDGSATLAHVTVWGKRPSRKSACTSWTQHGCVLPFSIRGNGKGRWSQFDSNITPKIFV